MDLARRRRAAGLLRSLALSYGISLVAMLFLPVPHKLVSGLLFGTVFGLSFFALGTFVIPRLRSRSFALTVLCQALAFSITIAAVFGFCLWVIITARADRSPFDPEVMRALRQVVWGQELVFPFLGALAVAALITFFFQFSRKLGPGVLWNWMTGRYHEPREEERIFMFVDMKDSTVWAERLSTLAFSSLVRDFLQDLSGPVLATRGEVSHYIGDEAVLTWRMDRGLKDGNCIRCFFLIEKAIARRADHYQNRYGMVPEFKAGAHCGPVVATEVGEIKSEIVYHGDTLNTAARIQGLCGELGRRLLVSSELASRLRGCEFEALGEFTLKGKRELVVICAPLNHHPTA